MRKLNGRFVLIGVFIEIYRNTLKYIIVESYWRLFGREYGKNKLVLVNENNDANVGEIRQKKLNKPFTKRNPGNTNALWKECYTKIQWEENKSAKIYSDL